MSLLLALAGFGVGFGATVYAGDGSRWALALSLWCMWFGILALSEKRR